MARQEARVVAADHDGTLIIDTLVAYPHLYCIPHFACCILSRRSNFIPRLESLDFHCVSI